KLPSILNNKPWYTNIDEKEIIEILKNAHLEYITAVEKIKSYLGKFMRDFKKDRTYISHDKFKNEFLVSIGYDIENPNSPNRNLKFYGALKGDKSRIDQIRKAFLEWPELHSTIVNFLSELPQRYGLILSKEFEKEKPKVFKALNNMNEFIEHFDSDDINEDNLGSFWNSVDKVRIFLNNLGYERNRYIIDINPLLIKENCDEK
ncbi:hypothetical protein ACFL6I_29345, partial [candidate division KSB1 bacterium]